ncbi:MAG: hypothetical protein HOJ35_10455 [Bdellovibrionales bacterium]|nr:hypothetical protein [Bdellovibrionales bacterium]
MKRLLILAVLTWSSLVLASSELDRDNFSYYGDQTRTSRDLTTNVYRTVTREVQVPATCTRRVPYSHQVCHNETRYRERCTTTTRRVCKREQVCRRVNGRRVCRVENVCRNVPQRTCRQVPYQERVCRTETRYRNESYSCTRTERRTVNELVRRTEAMVGFSFVNNSSVYDVQADFSLVLRDNQLSVNARNIDEFNKALFIADSNESRSYTGKTEYLRASYAVRVYNLERFSSPVSRQPQISSSTRNGQLEVVIGKVLAPNSATFKLVLKDERGLVLFNRELTEGEYRFRNNPEPVTKVMVNLRRLLGSRYFSNTNLKVKFVAIPQLPAGTVLNTEEVNLSPVKSKQLVWLD